MMEAWLLWCVFADPHVLHLISYVIVSFTLSDKLAFSAYYYYTDCQCIQ